MVATCLGISFTFYNTDKKLPLNHNQTSTPMSYIRMYTLHHLIYKFDSESFLNL